jgi:transcriptional regulator with XRE-family HTH domain
MLDRIRIKYLLAVRGVSLSDIATSAEVSLTAVSKFLRGINNSEKISNAIKSALKVEELPVIEPEIELPSIIGCTAESRPLTVRLPLELEAYVLKQSNRSAWLREAVREKMEREISHPM